MTAAKKTSVGLSRSSKSICGCATHCKGYENTRRFLLLKVLGAYLYFGAIGILSNLSHISSNIFVFWLQLISGILGSHSSEASSHRLSTVTNDECRRSWHERIQPIASLMQRDEACLSQNWHFMHSSNNSQGNLMNPLIEQRLSVKTHHHSIHHITCIIHLISSAVREIMQKIYFGIHTFNREC